MNPNEAPSFWKNIWGKKRQHRKDAGWLQIVSRIRAKTGKDYYHKWKRNDESDEEDSKLENFLPYCVLGFWFYSFQCIYENLRENLQYCMDDGSVPDSITLVRCVLTQKEKTLNQTSNNYRPITCLPLDWKKMTVIIAEEMYLRSIPEEEKVYKGSTERWSHIDYMVLSEARIRVKNYPRDGQTTKMLMIWYLVSGF